MTTTPKELEIAAIAISITAGCIPCTRYHVREAKQQGASLLEMMHVLTVASSASAPNGLSDIAQREVWKLFESSEQPTEELRRQAFLAEIGISVCQNNVELLKTVTAGAKEAGLTDDQIMEIIGLAQRIKEKAASHLEAITRTLDADPSIAQNAAKLCS